MEKAAEDTGFGLYISNLVLLLLLGLAVSGWVLYYTEWFPVFGGLLGLGGLFAWIAFVSGLLRDERKAQMQRWFEKAVLLRHTTWIAVAAAASLLVLWAAGHGSIVLDALRDDTDRAVTITESSLPSASPVHEDHIGPRGERTYPVRTRLFSTGTYRVKMSGLPPVVVTLGAFRKASLSTPASFLSRPVLLVTPMPVVAATVRAGGFLLDVSRNGIRLARLDDYRGESVWIGTDADTAVAQTIKDRWKLESVDPARPVDATAFEMAKLRWSKTRAAAEDAGLRDGDEVIVTLLHPKDGHEMARAAARVHAVTGPQDVPQLEWLKPPVAAPEEKPHDDTHG